MSPKTQNNRWVADPDQFAARIQVEDLPGMLANQLIVEPGTRALIVNDGIYAGDVGAGTYTLKTFMSNLAWCWPI